MGKISTLLLTLFIAASASATTVPRLDIRDLARSSAMVVHGRVSRHWSGWDDTHRFIWTHYELRIQDSLKGDARGVIVISEPGGVVDDMGMRIEGVPEYRDGEEVVAFLHLTPIGYWRSYGLRQGRFAVVRDAAGRKRIHTELSGMNRIARAERPTAGARALALSIEKADGMPLDQFKRLVIQEARQQ